MVDGGDTSVNMKTGFLPSASLPGTSLNLFLICKMNAMRLSEMGGGDGTRLFSFCLFVLSDGTQGAKLLLLLLYLSPAGSSAQAPWVAPVGGGAGPNPRGLPRGPGPRRAKGAAVS